MAKYAIEGVAGARPHVPKSSKGPSLKEEAHALDMEYRVKRNLALDLANRDRQIKLAQKHGLLVPRRQVQLQSAYLFSELRQEILARHHSLPRRLAGLSEHEMMVIIREEDDAMLRELSQWGERIVDPGWLKRVEGDAPPGKEKPRPQKARGVRRRDRQKDEPA